MRTGRTTLGFNLIIGASFGDALKGAVIATAAAAYLGTEGNIFSDLPGLADVFRNAGDQIIGLANAVQQGVTNGVFSAIGGGDFGAGFLTGLSGSVLDGIGSGVLNQFGDNMLAGLAVSVVVGGTVSVIGGGKFGNGALSAAMNYATDAIGRSLASRNNDLRQYQNAPLNEDGTLEHGSGSEGSDAFVIAVPQSALSSLSEDVRNYTEGIQDINDWLVDSGSDSVAYFVYFKDEKHFDNLLMDIAKVHENVYIDFHFHRVDVKGQYVQFSRTRPKLEYYKAKAIGQVFAPGENCRIFYCPVGGQRFFTHGPRSFLESSISTFKKIAGENK